MKNQAITILIFLLILVPSCSRKYLIIHSIEPVENIKTEVLDNNIARIRSFYCVVHMEPVNVEKWQFLLNTKIFTHKETKKSQFRIPPLALFQVAVENTSDKPITIEGLELIYKDQVIPALTLQETTDRLKSDMYKFIDIGEVFHKRLLISDNPAIGTTSFDTDTIRSELDFIPPGDTVIFFVPFDFIAVEKREFTIKITVAQNSDKKSIDFDFRRFEYRSEGEHFVKPEDESEKEELLN